MVEQKILFWKNRINQTMNKNNNVVWALLILMRSLKCGEIWDQTENVGFEEGSLAES